MTNQSGFTEPSARSEGSIERRIRESWIAYLTKTLGRSAVMARERAEKDVNRTMAAQVVQEMTNAGWKLKGTEILEIGSGHGSLGIELALAGACVTAIEPCEAWRLLSEERAAFMGLAIQHLDADAHHLPFPDGRFDGCVSLQVLEHVREPEQVISEVSRVLKPGGRILVSCENYLSFWEPHYGVPWLPFLAKRVGAFYLRLLGRDPAFLRDHVTYTSAPSLAKAFMDAGLYDRAWDRVLADCEGGALETRRLSGSIYRALYHAVRKIAGESYARATIACLINRRSLFRTAFGINGIKRNSKPDKYRLI
jgi:2-polyprenyl-3-methyl-5-hydroxy-6-metoxy-1,4-benzoquinol methylase